MSAHRPEHYMAWAKSHELLLPSICLLLLSGHLGYAASLSFFHNFSDHTTFRPDDLRFEGAAYASNSSIILAKERPNGYITSTAGRVSYNHPVHLWSNATGEVTGFSASFSFVINGCQTTSDTGGGLAFFLAPFPSRMPLNSGGGYLGLFNSTTAAGMSASSGERVVAVELDTYGDLGWDPTMSPHIGVDLNTIASEENYYKVAGNLADGTPKTVQIDYRDVTKDLVVTLRDSMAGTSLITMKTSVDLRQFLPREVAIGFSAATGVSHNGIHQVLWWSFSTNPTLTSNLATTPARAALEAPANSSAPPLAGPAPRAKKSNRAVVGSVVGAVLFVVTAVVVAFLCCLSKKTRKTMAADTAAEAAWMSSASGMDGAAGMGGAAWMGGAAGMGDGPIYPRWFSYEELSNATDSFSEERLLGEGGVGTVHRGEFTDSFCVAVKRLKINFEEALRTDTMNHLWRSLEKINHLRHQNLVKLMGWCSEGDDLYLVYEFVQNGSLGDHLYNQARLLTWPIRYKILHGVGCALVYLHGKDPPILHRNIKPNNVMLDESFDAKLGDFGLALQINQDEGSSSYKAKVAATQGYMDPEFLVTREASMASDVYSFGVVLLEIACGRPPISLEQNQAATATSLVNLVWELCDKGAILDAADKRLNGEFDRDEMERVMLVGLWCALPDSSQRPSIGRAMDWLLKFDIPLPRPPKMPVPASTTAERGSTSAGHTSSLNP